MNTTDELEFLAQFVTDRRKARIEEILSQRTRHISIALENIYQTHNAAAVLRSCDCFGIQDAHIIENSNSFTPSPDVSLQADKWLSLRRYNQEENNTLACIRQLKAEGYKVIGTSLHKNSIWLDEVDLSEPVAVVFGTELTGISEIVEQEADVLMKIPMYGFSESFNISVSAAIILSQLRNKLEKEGIDWELSEDEKEAIRLDWYRKSTKARLPKK